MLAHELRNPLAPITNAMQILRLIGSKEPALGGVRDMIERQVKHLVRLVDDLLDISRISSGKFQLQKVKIELSAVVRQALEASQPLMDSRHHDVRLSLPAAPTYLEGDFIRLAQVVSNLLNNAAKYTDPGGTVWLTVEREEKDGGPQATISVRDNGRGLDPDGLERLFQMFYQVDRNLDRSDGGLGVGLALVKNIVEMHGGRVEAQSAGPGWGSEFIVHLPALREEAPARKTTNAAASASSAPRRRILVVDDNRDSADSMAIFLRLEGHDVSTAYDGEEAVQLGLQWQPDVVLLDVSLPKLNGIEACRALRAGNLTQTLMIAMTGYGQEMDRELSREAGFDLHMTKPLSLDALRKTLRERVQSELANATNRGVVRQRDEPAPAFAGAGVSLD
jgi:CheY-like chemotaxis protein